MKKALIVLLTIFGIVSIAQATPVNLTWTAPVDDKGEPSEGPVASYRLKYSVSSITEANFNNATAIPTGTPKAYGQQESYIVDLPQGKHYFFAVKAVDLQNNIGTLSNVAAKDFLAPSQVTDLLAQ
jgi:hypothetical protein